MDNHQKIHDTEDKVFWVKLGEGKEKYFVGHVAPLIPLEAQINPQKISDEYAPDLLLDGGRIADLKAQNTPFFKAQMLYGIPAQYAVTFNKKDYDRYSRYYPHIIVVFWVSWEQVSLGGLSVDPMAGVWSCGFSELSRWINTGSVPLHEYKFRKNDTKGNAKSSYVLDLRRLKMLKKFI